MKGITTPSATQNFNPKKSSEEIIISIVSNLAII